MTNPLAIDLFCGLGGWSEGLLAEGWHVIGFDIERHEYGGQKYPGTLVLQDVLTLHGSQFRGAALIVASPPCQAYSYRAMPWSRAKALPPPDNTLFEACFRIQREACEAAGRHIPMVVENVRGAQKWVGRARWNYGSFYLWGDVPALMPYSIVRFHKIASPHMNFCGARSAPGNPWRTKFEERQNSRKRKKKPGFRFDASDKSFQSAEAAECGIKCGGDGFNADQPSISRLTSSKSPARKAAAAIIAKIPLPLARHIARVFRP